MFQKDSGKKDKDYFLKQANDAREKRMQEKKRISSALKIQSYFRGYLVRKKFYTNLE